MLFFKYLIYISADKNSKYDSLIKYKSQKTFKLDLHSSMNKDSEPTKDRDGKESERKKKNKLGFVIIALESFNSEILWNDKNQHLLRNRKEDEWAFCLQKT